MRKKRINLIISLILSFSVIFVMPVSGEEIFTEAEEISEVTERDEAPDNTEDFEAMEEPQEALLDHVTGLLKIPEKFIHPAPKVESGLSYSEAVNSITEGNAEVDSLPSTYRHDSLPQSFPEGDILYYIDTHLPNSRNQRPYGTCWAFQTVALGEAYMINHYGASTDIDYSEVHMLDTAYRTINNPVVGNAVQGGSMDITLNPGKKYADLGGLFDLEKNIITKGIGFAEEEAAPYNTDTLDSMNNNTLSVDPFLSSCHVKHAMEINITENPELVKGAIMENGIVGIDLYMTSSGSPYYNSSHNSYYSDMSYATHAVSIVGWNDEFPKENFIYTPAGDGAWLIRNTWEATDNAEFGKETYFWLSYYEPSIQGSSAHVIECSDRTDEYDNNYYYDIPSHLNCESYNADSIANVYKVQGKGGSEYEQVKEVQFAVETVNPGGSYEIDIYTGLTDPSSPESGVQQKEAVTTGKLYFNGIYTVELSNPVYVKKDSYFSVVIKNDSHLFGIEASTRIDNYDTGHVYTEVDKQRSQSMTLKNGVWTDSMDDPYFSSDLGNYCISVHTSDSSFKSDTEKTVFKDKSGGEVILLHDLENDTYKTSDGKDVLVLSFANGSASGTPKYEYTGKKITPAKDAFVVYKGVMYEYKKDYTIKYKKNKNNGSATVVIKWKKSSEPFKAGLKKSKIAFTVAPRSVSDNMVSFSVKNDKLKKLRVNADGNSMKPKKKDFSYTRTGDLFNIVFKNNYKGTVNKKG